MTAWAQHPPGARSVVVGGRARPIPVGCDAAGSVATCEDGTRAELETGQCARGGPLMDPVVELAPALDVVRTGPDGGFVT